MSGTDTVICREQPITRLVYARIGNDVAIGSMPASEIKQHPCVPPVRVLPRRAHGLRAGHATMACPCHTNGDGDCRSQVTHQKQVLFPG